MKTNIIKLTNEQINEMVSQYQATPSENLYNDIHEAVYPMAEQVAFRAYHNSLKLCSTEHLTVDDFTACSYIAVFKALQSYDFEKAGATNFTTSVKQFVKWTIEDTIFKKAKNKEAQMLREAVSLDKPAKSDEGSDLLSAVESHYSTDVDAVFNAVLESVKTKDENSLINVLFDLVLDFSAIASEDDTTIIKTWVATIFSITDGSADIKKLVNTALADSMPGVAPATVRKKKSRAERKFNLFAKDNGFPDFCLSQF